MAKAIRIGNALVELRDAKTDKPDKTGDYLVIGCSKGTKEIYSITSTCLTANGWNTHGYNTDTDYISNSESSDYYWCSFGKEIIDVEL